MTSLLPVTSQVRSKLKCLICLLNRIDAQNNDVKRKQSKVIRMDGASDTYKYHSEYFVTIFQVKVIRGHEVKKSKYYIFVFWWCNTRFRSDFANNAKITLK